MKKIRFKQVSVKFLSAVCAIALLAGCGAKNESASMSNYAKATSDSYVRESKSDASYELWDDYSEEVSTEGSSGEDYSKSSASNRKLIKNVNMNVETQNYELLMSNVEAKVKELGGYVQNLESFNGSNYGNSYNYNQYKTVKRYATLTVRIPQQKLDRFVNTISDLSNVVNRKESVEDVTLQYVDVKSHKESLQVEQARLLELLERAETLEDIITLENRLTSVRYQIESMESTLRTYDDLVDYSTVTLRIDEVEVYTPVEEKKESDFDRMINGFVESVIDVKDGIVNFFIWIVIHLPYLVIWGIVITVIVILCKKFFKKSKAKKEAKREAMKEAARQERMQNQQAEKMTLNAEPKTEQKAEQKTEETVQQKAADGKAGEGKNGKQDRKPDRK